jgi:hypothetical protein
MVILLETYVLATSTSIREGAGLGQLWYAWLVVPFEID